MPVNVNEIIRKLSPAERKKVEDRAAGRVGEGAEDRVGGMSNRTVSHNA